MKVCPRCNAQNYDENSFCYRCATTLSKTSTIPGAPVYQRPFYLSGWFFGLVVVVVIIALYFGGAANHKNQYADSGYASHPTTQAIKPQPVKESELDKYEVIIAGITHTATYDNEKAVVVSYKWTNNGDRDASFALTLVAEAFQNGVECSRIYMLDAGDEFLLKSASQEIKPGTSQYVQVAYELNNVLAPVDVEVSYLYDFRDKPEAVTRTFEIG